MLIACSNIKQLRQHMSVFMRSGCQALSWCQHWERHQYRRHKDHCPQRIWGKHYGTVFLNCSCRKCAESFISERLCLSLLCFVKTFLSEPWSSVRQQLKYIGYASCSTLGETSILLLSYWAFVLILSLLPFAISLVLSAISIGWMQSFLFYCHIQWNTLFVIIANLENGPVASISVVVGCKDYFSGLLIAGYEFPCRCRWFLTSGS